MMCRGVQQGVECRCNRVQKGEWRRNNETGVKISRVNRVQKGVTGCKRYDGVAEGCKRVNDGTEMCKRANGSARGCKRVQEGLCNGLT